MTIKPLVKAFFDNDTNTFSYVVTDPVTKHCAVIDSVMNYDAASASMHYQQADEILLYIKQQGLTVEWILETHVHADHMTAAPYIQSSAGGKIAMSRKISVVQETFSKISLYTT
ncbi:MBL fold metallo-hydrolase, partial [Acinetobacter radioresistens]|uniref:MBL fold metallo-hydrolase n=1 Tax=Acinetobacter radioresistens TaxID=40216 RepID=UPI000CA90DE4